MFTKIRQIGSGFIRRNKVFFNRMKSLFIDYNKSPVFVLGNQKAGTTVIGALLAIHSDRSIILDIPAFNYKLEEIFKGQQSLETFVKAYSSYFATDIIKDNNLTFLISELSDIFPTSKYVLIVRDPRDNIRSILDRLSLNGNLSHNPNNLKKMKTGWKYIFNTELLANRGFDYKVYKFYIDILAERWRFAASIPMKYPSLDINVVKYEDFIKNKESYIVDLTLKIIGEKGSKSIKEKIDYNFQPKGKRRDLTWKDIFGTENLSRIEEINSDLMHHYDYTLSID